MKIKMKEGMHPDLGFAAALKIQNKWNTIDKSG